MRPKDLMSVVIVGAASKRSLHAQGLKAPSIDPHFAVRPSPLPVLEKHSREERNTTNKILRGSGAPQLYDALPFEIPFY